MNTQQGTDQVTTAVQQPAGEDFLFKVGDRGFTAEAAINKITHADAHISRLEQEAQERLAYVQSLELKLANSTQLAQAIEQLKTQSTSQQPLEGSQMSTTDSQALSNGTGTQPQGTQQSTPTVAPSVNLEELMAMVRNQLQADSQKATQEQNKTDCFTAAQAVYGTEYETKLLEKGKDLGFNSVAELQELASTRPALFKQTFGLNRQTATQPAPASTSTNTQAFGQQAPAKDWLDNQEGRYNVNARVDNFRQALEAKKKEMQEKFGLTR